MQEKRNQRVHYPRGVIGGEEPPERNVKKLRLLSLKAVVFLCFMRVKYVKNVNYTTLRLENLEILKDNCNFAAIKE